MPFLSECPCPDKYRWVVLPVPYEETTSYLRGTAGGPGAILDASDQLEVFDPRLGREAFRESGVYTDDTWEFEGSLVEVGRRVTHWMEQGKRVLALGGEHTITAAIVPAVKVYHPDLAVVHLDAHADLRDSYEGTTLSHACSMRRVLSHAPVYSMGIRAYCSEEAEVIRREEVSLLHAWEMDDRERVDAFLAAIPPTIYLTVDVDVLDPSEVPTVGTPQPGGLTYRFLVDLLERLMDGRDVVGADVVETRPVPGLDFGVFTVASLCHFLLSRA